MPISAAANQAVSDGKQPRLPIAMPASIDRNGLEAEVDGSQVGAACNAGLAEDRSGEQPAEPGRVLQDGKLVPGIEGDDRLQHRRQVFGLPQHDAPFVEPGILVPIEIINERVLFRRRCRRHDLAA